jgi:hypothetical protein
MDALVAFVELQDAVILCPRTILYGLTEITHAGLFGGGGGGFSFSTIIDVSQYAVPPGPVTVM